MARGERLIEGALLPVARGEAVLDLAVGRYIRGPGNRGGGCCDGRRATLLMTSAGVVTLAGAESVDTLPAASRAAIA